ncbi:two-component system response regulator RppA [Acaryochloris marina]|uniref:Two-component transcriptional regulator n=1 Tax=Acaryochloris marina (strain MBIC 11017) TaxID=329726 RepID=B0CBA3_ACAM1|nr:two-component system response regulator RppA [Acaryochloris marina]ABW26742.1 two-component transcriptional regulator [Acaryochloris marina MBIC11017]BDM81519.1 DNA-binding response regulator [Acaryochloris marina MBIC10699]
MSQILLVDDEVELTDALGRLLKREGYSVDVANDGEAALLAVQQKIDQGQLYDLLILDWMLPKLSGIEVCQELRSQSQLTPVLFLTAKDTLDDRVQGLDAGADDYLVKPFELRELLARVRALLRRSEQFSQTSPEALFQRIQMEGLELDLESQIAYCQGQAITLSEKESQLLTYLMQHPHQLLTHDQIYQHLWPSGDQPSSNVLAAQIRLLRRKIAAKNSPPLIHTIYGKGYWFGAKVEAEP